LRQHQAVQYFSSGTGRMNEMSFVIDQQTTSVKMRGTLAVNDGDAYVMCGVKGAGIIQSPRFMLLPHLRSGALVEVLPQWKPTPMPIAAVYPHNRHLAPKVRVFVEWIAMLFENCPLMSNDVDQQGRCVIADAHYGLVPQDNAHAVDIPVDAFA
jgi:LysR family transcriptional regulator for bpeEF and oprC